jgi:NitT/TauT family transport system substrate-binding protein
MGSGLRRLAMLVVVPLVLALAACGGSSSGGGGGAASGGGSKGRIKISLVVGTPAATPMYPYYVAKDKGYFDDEGLDVTINGLDGSGPTVQAFSSGAANVAEMTSTDVLNAVGSRPDFHPVMFFWSFYGNPLYVGAPDDSGIATASDLKGKTVGVSAINGAETNVLRNLATAAGLKEGSDYQIKPVGGGGQGAVALDKHAVDAYAGGINDLAIITARGIPMHKVQPPPGTKPPYGFGLWASQALIKSHPEALAAFGRAYAKAWRYIGDDPHKLMDTIQQISPQEVKEPKVALALAESSINLRKIPPGLGDKLGYIPPTDFERWWKLANTKAVRSGPDAYFTNQYNSSLGS